MKRSNSLCNNVHKTLDQPKSLRLRHTDCTYFLCPDKKCKLFTKPNGHVPCDSECPHSAKKAIVCTICGKTIILEYKHSAFCRIECQCGAMLFSRMFGVYRRHNLK